MRSPDDIPDYQEWVVVALQRIPALGRNVKPLGCELSFLLSRSRLLHRIDQLASGVDYLLRISVSDGLVVD
jgi:hypothetical protein